MTDDFEDHCWKDVITPDVLEVYSCYRRKVFVGPRPALACLFSIRPATSGRRAGRAW